MYMCFPFHVQLLGFSLGSLIALNQIPDVVRNVSLPTVSNLITAKRFQKTLVAMEE